MTERRSVTAELRTEGRRLTGHAALFGVETRIGDSFTEVIQSGAFAATLADGHDVLALADHDPTRVLARTRSGTLRLSEDARGLAFELDVPDTQAGRDMLALAVRGDLGGMSFGFRAVDERRDHNRRELVAVELFEVSVVSAFPAYPGTDVSARHAAGAFPARAAAMRRLRLLELAR